MVLLSSQWPPALGLEHLLMDSHVHPEGSRAEVPGCPCLPSFFLQEGFQDTATQPLSSWTMPQ